MNINKELIRIAEAIGNPLRSQSDYGFNDILSQLAEHAGLDLEEMRKSENVRSRPENN